MADGSTDKNGKEIEGFVVRYIDMEGFVVRYIDMEELVVKEHYLSLMLESLKNLDLKGAVVSQCYDGAERYVWQ